MGSFVSVIVNAVSSNARMVFKFSVLITFLAALTAFSIWFWGFMGDIYKIIDFYFVSLSNSLNSSNSFFCLLHLLGVDSFITSAFSIFYTAALFWITAVGYIITYRLGNRVYDGILKAL